MKLFWSDFKFGLKIGFETRFETGFGLGCQSGQNGVDGVVWVERAVGEVGTHELRVT